MTTERPWTDLICSTKRRGKPEKQKGVLALLLSQADQLLSQGEWGVSHMEVQECNFPLAFAHFHIIAPFQGKFFCKLKKKKSACGEVVAIIRQLPNKPHLSHSYSGLLTVMAF